MSLLDSTQLALESAMSGSMLRQSLLTNDLANADTPGFQPEDVNFQSTLESAIAQGEPLSQVSFTPFTQAQTDGPDGNGVDSDVTNAEISENGLLYQNLTEIAAAREGIVEQAMNTSSAP